MTQAKLKRAEHSESKKENDGLEEEKKVQLKRYNDKIIHIAAWVLLTLGLCIIVSTFYLAINHQAKNGDSLSYVPPTDNKHDQHDKTHNNDLNVDIIATAMTKKIIEIENANFKGCEEKLCKIICTKAEDLFKSLYHVMTVSECQSFDALMIYDQHFDDGILRNDWIDMNQTVQELAVLNSQITKIKSDTFNKPTFSTVFLMYWRNSNLMEVKSGALLGLHSLKYLMIDSKINCLDRAFFQPVQTTIQYLKIHAGLSIDKDESLFGIAFLKNLEYADLSSNNFNIPITKKTFQNAPNLKYLLLSRCKIMSIEEDAFEHLSGKLALLDLSHNILTTLSNNVLQPLLRDNAHSLVNIAMNGFVCDCNIKPLSKVYTAFRGQFMDAVYCKAPHEFYGKFIDEVDLNSLSCGGGDDETQTLINDSADDEYEGVATSTQDPTVSKTITSTTTFATTDQDDIATTVEMRCWHSPDSRENAMPQFSELFSSDHMSSSENDGSTNNDLIPVEKSSLTENVAVFTYPIDSLRFAPPLHDFSLHLFINRSVKVEIFDITTESLNVIWFDEDVEDFSKHANCLSYVNPFVITEPLVENQTYTFCMVPTLEDSITPLNCLPLYVAPEIEGEDVWIARDQKQFTIGMLCVLFLMSTFAGAAIAYIGIRAYPDLLEGSKNVLVIKKSEKACYVSTICEADYIKNSSLKKKPSSTPSIQQFSLPDTPTSVSKPSTISAGMLDRISSSKCSSIYFDDSFRPTQCLDDEYELPKPVKTGVSSEVRSIPNTYVATSPTRSPPPLPKRNSTACITDFSF